MATFTTVGTLLCAAHTSRRGGEIHGHTWHVWAKWAGEPRRDATELRGRLRAAVAELDHSVLPSKLSEGEDLAEAIGLSLEDCCAVRLERPGEMIIAEWFA